jgi:hypothetical protein
VPLHHSAKSPVLRVSTRTQPKPSLPSCWGCGILRFLNLSLKEGKLDTEPLVLAAMAGREYCLR